MIFKYKGFDKNINSSVKGTISANTLQEAEQKLINKNIYFEKLKISNSIFKDFFMRKDMPQNLLSSFSKELSSYIQSGMIIISAITLMENQHESEQRYKAFLHTVKTMIGEGKSLYTALKTQEIYLLPEFFLQSIKISSESGKMNEVLITMSNFFSTQSRTKKQLINALAYPLFIFFIAISMSIFLMVFVVPKITSIFKDTHQELPLITKIVLSISNFLTNHYVLILIFLIVLLITLNFLYFKIESFAIKVNTILLKTPFIGSIISNDELARFSYILSLMLKSGVPYAHAVKLASTTFGNIALKEKFKAATLKVLEGKKLFQALSYADNVKLQKNFMHALALGEESSEVASVMSSMAAFYIEENEDRLKIFMSLLEPAMMLFVGLIVGLIVAAMLLPIFTMSLGAVN